MPEEMFRQIADVKKKSKNVALLKMLAQRFLLRRFTSKLARKHFNDAIHITEELWHKERLNT